MECGKLILIRGCRRPVIRSDKSLDKMMRWSVSRAILAYQRLAAPSHCRPNDPQAAANEAREKQETEKPPRIRPNMHNTTDRFPAF